MYYNVGFHWGPCGHMTEQSSTRRSRDGIVYCTPMRPHEGAKLNAMEQRLYCTVLYSTNLCLVMQHGCHEIAAKGRDVARRVSLGAHTISRGRHFQTRSGEVKWARPARTCSSIILLKQVHFFKGNDKSLLLTASKA